MRKIALMIAALACASGPAFAQTPCPLPSQKPMSMVELFFGLDIAGRGPLTDAEWRGFAAKTLSHHFPDGFTAYEGSGQWMDPERHRIVREKSKIVQVVTDDDASFAAKITAVSDAYKKQFRQQSVGVVTSTVCAAF
jgi:hypothetical protein